MELTDRELDWREDGAGIECEERLKTCRDCQWYVGLEPAVDLDSILAPLRDYMPPGLASSISERVKAAAYAHVCFRDGHERWPDDDPCETMEER